MNMIIRGSVLFSLLCATVGMASETTVTVAGTREFRLAVVDGGKPTASRAASHAAFAECLGEAISGKSGPAIGVNVKCVSADQAAFNLTNGVYDAVLVLSGSLPRALMISDVTRLSATLGSGKTEKKVYMIFNNGDVSLAKLLSSSFSLAMTDTKFLDAVDGFSSRIAAADTGKKVAITP